MTAPVTAPTTNAIKSGIITNLDASPIVRATSGFGAAGALQRAVGTATPAASQATTDLIRMVRVPSNAIIQAVKLLFDTEPTTAIANIGVWYSDDVRDGTGIGNQGNLTAISSAFFATVLDLSDYFPSTTTGSFANPQDANAVIQSPTWVDVTFANAAGAFTDGQYIPSQSVNPLWLAIANNLALQTTPVGAFTQTTQQAHFNTPSAGTPFVRSDDPGGFLDICVQFTTTGSSANKVMTMVVDYINPGI